MQVSIISDIAEFKRIKEDWGSLFETREYSIFQSFEFSYYSWKFELSKNHQNHLYVIEVRVKSLLVAIFPLYIDPFKRLRFINDKHADFCDFLIHDNFDVELISSYVSRYISSKSLYLINLREDSVAYNLFRRGKFNNYYIQSFQKYSDLIFPRGSFPDRYDRYKSKNKAVFRRIKRVHHDKSHIILSRESDDFPLKDILLLKERMIKSGLRGPSFLSNDRLMLIEELFNSNRLVISIIHKDVDVHAISFILKKSNEYLFWISLFDNIKMIHIYNYILFIQAVSNDGKVCINFGRGAYDYKLTNFKPDVKLLFTVFVFQNKLQRIIFVSYSKVKMIIRKFYMAIKT